MKNLIQLIKQARFVYVCGNGGSAATAEHFTNDLFSKGIKAICLNSNTSIMTMIANDFGYQYVFGNQLEIYGSNEDLLITLSCSGTSPNVLKALWVAGNMGMKTYSFEIFESIRNRDYGKLEDKHLAFAHEITKAL